MTVGVAKAQFPFIWQLWRSQTQTARLRGVNVGVGPQFRLPTTWFWAIAWIVGIVAWLMMDWNSISRLLGF